MLLQLNSPDENIKKLQSDKEPLVVIAHNTKTKVSTSFTTIYNLFFFDTHLHKKHQEGTSRRLYVVSIAYHTRRGGLSANSFSENNFLRRIR